MFTITDYYNLIDFNGYIFDAIHDFGLPLSETIAGLYNNFVDNTTKAEQNEAHAVAVDIYNASEKSKINALDLVNMWAYDSISHGI